MELSVDPALLPVWDAGGPAGVALRGLAVATAAGRVAAIVVTGRPLDDAELARLARGLAGALGTRAVELVALDAAEPAALLRQWVNQAAQGSGRGVRVESAVPGTILVSAIDSSARELASRLASPTEPALAALRALLAEPDLVVADAEGEP